jgi:hypothetical protein
VLNYSESSGPGEYNSLRYLLAEAPTHPIPDGEVPGVAPDVRRQTVEMLPVCLEGFSTSLDAQEAIRRTGIDSDGLFPVLLQAEAVEQSVDRSADDCQRESAFDFVLDDTGPQPDQG